MSNNPRIAVIVVNWNSGPLLDRCLESLRGQTLAPAQVFVVDNASNDGSWTCVAERFGFATLIRRETNSGFAAANNLAARRAENCDWLALLNPDAFAEPDWLERLWAAARSNPQFSFFGCRMLRDGERDRFDGTGDVCHVSGLAWRRDHGHKVAGNPRDTEEEIFSPCAAAAMYRRDAFLEAGGFDESFFCYFEDVDLAFRLRHLGHRCLYVPSATVAHVGSALAGERSDFAVYHGHRNLVWSYFKNMPGILFWLYFPQHLLCNFAALAWFVLRGQGGAILRAKFDALTRLPKVLEDRRRVQSTSRVHWRDIVRTLARGLLDPYLNTLGRG